MNSRHKYRKKSGQTVVAVQLKLDTEGFSYHKWGAEQHCKGGDWLVNNNGDVYTVSNDIFIKTYQTIEPGRYIKITPIWAEEVTEEGSIETREGRSHYKAGDYLVSNNEDGSDAYCIEASRFKDTYEVDDQENSV